MTSPVSWISTSRTAIASTRSIYKVIRAWEQSAESILRGDPGAWPLAPLANVPTTDVPEVIQDIEARLARKTRFEFSGIIMQSTLILAGLRLGKDEIDALQGRLPMRFRGLEKSSCFEWLKEQARIQQARDTLLRQGRIRFGPPGSQISREIKAIRSLEHLVELSERLLKVSTWTELLDESS